MAVAHVLVVSPREGKKRGSINKIISSLPGFSEYHMPTGQGPRPFSFWIAAWEEGSHIVIALAMAVRLPLQHNGSVYTRAFYGSVIRFGLPDLFPVPRKECKAASLFAVTKCILNYFIPLFRIVKL